MANRDLLLLLYLSVLVRISVCLNRWQDLGSKTATAAKTACLHGKSLPTIRRQEELQEIQAQIGKTSETKSHNNKNAKLKKVFKLLCSKLPPECPCKP